MVPMKTVKRQTDIFIEAREIDGYVRHRKSGLFYKPSRRYSYREWDTDVFCISQNSGRGYYLYCFNVEPTVYKESEPEIKEIDWL